MRVAAFAALLSTIPVVASAQTPPPPNEPVVQVGLYGYRSDGSIGSSAHDTAPELSSIVYVNGRRCLMGAGNRPAPADATDVWQFTGKVLSITPEQAVVQLKWRRTVANGLRIDGNESSQRLNLRFGEAVQLDQAGMESTPGCPTVAVGFEARYSPRFWGGPPGVLGGGRGRAGGSGGSSGSGAASVKMGTVAQSGGFGTNVAVPQAGGGGGGMVSAAGSGLFDVNLWLVRAVPGRPDEVTHSLLRMNESGASFSFAPITVTTSRGEAIVQVTGTLAVRGTSGEEQLVFSTSRRVGLTAPGQAPRDSVPDSSGTSRIINRMPGPEEVLSFEMPPITLNGQQAAPDQFSVRLKIAPRRQPGELQDH